jgi:hypothetical protein
MAIIVSLTALPVHAQMKRLGEQDGIRVIRQLEINQQSEQSTFRSKVSISPAAVSFGSTHGAAPGLKTVSTALPAQFDTRTVQFDTKRLDQSGGITVYRDLDKNKRFETSTYKPKIYKSSNAAVSPIRNFVLRFTGSGKVKGHCRVKTERGTVRRIRVTMANKSYSTKGKAIRCTVSSPSMRARLTAKLMADGQLVGSQTIRSGANQMRACDFDRRDAACIVSLLSVRVAA